MTSKVEKLTARLEGDYKSRENEMKEQIEKLSGSKKKEMRKEFDEELETLKAKHAKKIADAEAKLAEKKKSRKKEKKEVKSEKTEDEDEVKQKEDEKEEDNEEKVAPKPKKCPSFLDVVLKKYSDKFEGKAAEKRSAAKEFVVTMTEEQKEEIEEIIKTKKEEYKLAIAAFRIKTNELKRPAEEDDQANIPPPPKRGLSAHILYSNGIRNEVTEQLKAEHGDAFKYTLVMTKCCEMYKALSDEEKKPFVEMAAKAQQDFKIAMAEFKEKYPNYRPKKTAKKGEKPESTNMKRDPNAPKRPLTSYMVYLRHIREHPEEIQYPEDVTSASAKNKYIMTEGAKKWRGLSKEEKLVFELVAKKLAAKYAIDLKEYKEKKAAEEGKVIIGEPEEAVEEDEAEEVSDEAEE
eukprot:TRINITY_DN25750_c0_g1_i1.p1 TRINITY_DN25750_c0_g1~~TRINITY_DN25750_c0_g1_i1.p1  ORF type:complete len:405 (+),score=223.47 TRINITY_DN25750_c0_g1_i1:61-1275(+)